MGSRETGDGRRQTGKPERNGTDETHVTHGTGSGPEGLAGLLGRFGEALRAEDLSEKTIRNYVNDVSLFARFIEEQYGEEFQPGRTVQREVTEYRSWLLAKSAAGATVNRRLNALKKFFGWYGTHGTDGTNRTENPAAGVKGIRLTDPGVQALSLVELRRLMREVHVHGVKRDIAILELLCGTGMRVGELTALRIRDVEIGERSGSVMIRSGKGRASREIPLNPDVRSALSAHLAEQDGQDDQDAGGGWLFTGQRGKLTACGVWKIVRKYGNYAGIADLRVHQLRHTFLTRLVRDGVDLVIVAKLSGHRSFQPLLRYAQASREDVSKAVDGLALGESGT
jgi:integrase/recombinase XerD